MTASPPRLVRLDGSGRMPVAGAFAATKPSWSPNSRRIAAGINGYYGLEIAVFSVEGKPTYSYVTEGYQAAWRNVP